MGTYVRYYCPLKKQQIDPAHVGGLSNKIQHQEGRVDIGQLLVHLLVGSLSGPHWFMVCLAHDGTPRHPDGGLPGYDTVRGYEDVTELAVESFNESQEGVRLVYDPPPHYLRPLRLTETRTLAQLRADGDDREPES